MKRILCTILTLACSVVLTACGASSTSSEAVTYGFLDETLGTENYAIGFRLGDEERLVEPRHDLGRIVDGKEHLTSAVCTRRISRVSIRS